MSYPVTLLCTGCFFEQYAELDTLLPYELLVQDLVFGQISSKFARREFSIFIIFSDAYRLHVLMLCRNFELIPIKIGFLKKFLKLLKNWVQDPVQGLWSKFCEND